MTTSPLGAAEWSREPTSLADRQTDRQRDAVGFQGLVCLSCRGRKHWARVPAVGASMACPDLDPAKVYDLYQKYGDENYKQVFSYMARDILTDVATQYNAVSVPPPAVCGRLA